MKLLSNYHRTVTEPIYIFATGPSLLMVDPENYRDKLCFGINYAFQKMLHIDYTLVHELETYEIIKEIFPNNRLILPTKLNRNMTYEHCQIHNDESIFYYKHKFNLRDNKEIKLYLGAFKHIFAYTTTTHSAIHIAAYMGARTIYLIGVDYCCYPDKSIHFKTGVDRRYDEQDWQVFEKHKQGDQYITKKLAAKGIQVINLSSDIMNGRCK